MLDGDYDDDGIPDESRGPYFPHDRRERYPTRLKVDFRRLPRKTLLTYTAHHDLHIRPDITHEELAIAAARHFAVWRVNEESIMRSFCASLHTSTLGNGRGLGDDEIAAAATKRQCYDTLDVVPPSPEQKRAKNPLYTLSTAAAIESTTPLHSSKGGKGAGSKGTNLSNYYGEGTSGSGRNFDHGQKDSGRNDWRNVPQIIPSPSCYLACRVSARGSDLGGGGPEFLAGEQVAAHMTRKEDDMVSRAWILARVVRELSSGMVELCDEDDISHVFQLSQSDVRHLEDNSEQLHKHDRVKAVFPDTTMFYGARVARDLPRVDGGGKVMLVYFEDDEDASGKTHYRRVPVHHVIFDHDHHDHHRNRMFSKTGSSGGTGGRRTAHSHSGSQRAGGSKPRASGSSSRARGGGGGGRDLVARASGGESMAAGSNRPGGKEQGKKCGSATYADMIAHALGKVEGGRGAFNHICRIIEQDFHDGLNWKLESDVRRTPVWRSSVRKILFSNNRFHHAGTTSEQGHIFTMACTKKK